MTDAPFPLDGATEVRPPSAPPPSPSTRFAPGTLLAERYRIVAQLGRGGMGEVYRADDLKLGHPVALKFLPREFANDSVRMERLLAEVRIGRQVSHPNVCRLYDIVEWQGTHFMAMEYVDGEDLASLLRRIGRLPADKALDIARDLAAGIAAAHDLGVIHRDLKPANVMVDGRGRARITDFGLASLADDPSNRGVSGTPAYMSPEQLRGEPLTPRSDLYALGLIYFEIFTGRRVFEGNTLDEVIRKRASTKTPSVSSMVREIEPAVERVIARCLEEEPSSRPASAHVVLASLPGGDPLAAALAAGETPSPEMVAAAGAVGDLSPRIAWSLFAAVSVIIVVIAAMSARSTIFGNVSLPKSTEVLQARAQEMLELIGFDAPVVDTAGDWVWNTDFLRYVARRGRPRGGARPGVVGFWARFSPRPLLAWQWQSRILSNDPPLNEPGMTNVLLDPQGRLIRFFRVPPDKVAAGALQPVDWTPFFRFAAIDPARFRPAPPAWTHRVSSDAQYAWDGSLAESPEVPLRIEAASRGGKPVAFALYGPWDQPRAEAVPPTSFGDAVTEYASLLIELVGYAVGIVLALKNLQRGRGDRKAAFRLAAFSFALTFIALLLRADYRGFVQHDWDVIKLAAGFALLTAGSAWLLYIALEPYVRRKWPHLLISWSRLIAGRLRDPMVGRDVLVGLMAGTTLALTMHLTRIAPMWLGLPSTPFQAATSPFTSARHALHLVLMHAPEYLRVGLILLGVWVGLSVLTRRQFLANLLMGTLLSCAFFNLADDLRFGVAAAGISAAILLLVIVHRGLLSVTVAAYTWAVIRSLPPTLDTSAWYFWRFELGAIIVAALALFGLIVSVGTKPLFGTPLVDD